MAQHEPIGHLRDDLNAGIIASTIATFAPTKKRKAWKPSDFMPLIKKPETHDDLKGQIRNFFSKQPRA